MWRGGCKLGSVWLGMVRAWWKSVMWTGSGLIRVCCSLCLICFKAPWVKYLVLSALSDMEFWSCVLYEGSELIIVSIHWWIQNLMGYWEVVKTMENEPWLKKWVTEGVDMKVMSCHQHFSLSRSVSRCPWDDHAPPLHAPAAFLCIRCNNQLDAVWSLRNLEPKHILTSLIWFAMLCHNRKLTWE